MSKETPAMPHIMVVEDDPVSRALLVGYFEKEGYRVSASDNADDLLQRVEQERIALVLLDIRLPGKDGLTLTRELRAASRVGIILVTARDDEIDRIVGLELGADDYVTKPFNPRELLVRARNLLWRVAQCAGSETREAEQGCFRFEGWTLNPHKRQLVEWTPNDRTVDVLVGRVRRKLDDNPADPRLILTAHGAGYLFAGELD